MQTDVFAPSDIKNPEQTMAHVQLTASMKVDPKNGDKYIHTVTINTSGFRDSKPDFSVLTARADKNRVPDFSNQIQNYEIRLEPEVTFSKELVIPKYPTLNDVRFRIFGGDGRSVATLFVPYLMERE